MTFSLKELQELEQQRIDGEARAREDAEMARLAAERRANEERIAAERTLAEQRALAKRREDAELAEREAMQKAIVEQARLEVEIRARAEERERERRHEIDLARLRSSPPAEPRRAVLAFAAFAGALVSLALCAAMFLGIARPGQQRRLAELDRALAAADERGDTLARRGEEQRKVVAELKAELEAAKAGGAPVGTPKAAGPLRTPPTTTPIPTKKKATAQEAPCPAGDKDPMCFSLPK